MPTYRAATHIRAAPTAVFDYISDLTRHGEWSADPLQVEALDSGPVAVGQRYRSTAQVRGRPVSGALRVTRYEPPSHFAFVAEDLTGRYEHLFTVEAHAGGSWVERRIDATLSPMQALLFALVYFIVKRPNTVAAMQRLKTTLEQRSATTTVEARSSQ